MHVPGWHDATRELQRLHAGDEADVPEPDPEGRIFRDHGDFIRVETVLVPPVISPGEAVRVHLEFQPIAEKLAHWNNEADDLQVWLERPGGYDVDRRRLSVPNPPEAVSSEVRRVGFELRPAQEAGAEPARLRGYALYYVCEGVDGTCLYRRQDIEVPLPLRTSR